ERVKVGQGEARHPAGVGVGYCAGREAIEHLVVGRIWQEDHVERRTQIAGANITVEQALVRELELLEQPASPSLVHVAAPAVIETDSRRAHAIDGWSRPDGSRNRIRGADRDAK